MKNSNEITGIEFILEMNKRGVIIVPSNDSVKLRFPDGVEFESKGSYDYILGCVEKILGV